MSLGKINPAVLTIHFRRMLVSTAMVRMPRKDCAGTVNLFEQHDANELMGPRCGAERQPDFGPLQQTRRKPARAADDKTGACAAVGPPLLDQSSERRTIEVLAPLIECGDNSAIGNDVGERDRFFGASPVAVLRAALPNFDDFDRAPAKRTSRRLRAFGVPSCELALWSLLQATDSGDDHAHNRVIQNLRCGRSDPRRAGRASSRAVPAGSPTTSSRYFKRPPPPAQKRE